MSKSPFSAICSILEIVKIITEEARKDTDIDHKILLEKSPSKYSQFIAKLSLRARNQSPL
jgi:hypothetical protein